MTNYMGVMGKNAIDDNGDLSLFPGSTPYCNNICEYPTNSHA